MECKQCEDNRMRIEKTGILYSCVYRAHTCNQPERSKREDSLLRELLENSSVDFSKLKDETPYPLVWDKDLNFIGHKVFKEMRCSEHGSNVVRDK